MLFSIIRLCKDTQFSYAEIIRLFPRYHNKLFLLLFFTVVNIKSQTLSFLSKIIKVTIFP